MSKETLIKRIRFQGGGIVPDTGSPDSGEYVKTITGAAPPTITHAGGELVLALTSDTQVQNACWSSKDHLAFDIDALRRVTIYARLAVALGAAALVRFGMASARADDPDAIAQSLFFGLDGDANVNVECDDGTSNELDAVATLHTLATVERTFVFDFTQGVHAVAPPDKPVGGKGKILPYMHDGNGTLQPIVPNSRLNMNAYSGGLQPYAQIQKTSSDNVGSLAIRGFDIEYETDV